MAQLVKTVQGLAIASVKTVQGLAIASVKTIQGLDNTSAGGPVTFDAASGASASATPGTTETFSHTCTGSDLALFVGVATYLGGADDVTVTYNGVSMTKVWYVSDGAVTASYGFVLGNPATGANNVVVTWNSPDEGLCGSVSFANCNTAAPTGTPVEANGNSATGTVTVTDFGSNDMLVDCFTCFQNAVTVGADQTSRREVDGHLGNFFSFFVSTQPGSVAGGVMSGTLSAQLWCTGAVAIKVKP